MFIFNGFTECANHALNSAINTAQVLGHTSVGSEHLLYGICAQTQSTGEAILSRYNIKCEQLLLKLKETFGVGIKIELTPADLTPRGKRILENSLIEARALKHKNVGTEHILMSLLQESDSYAALFLQELGADIREMYMACVRELDKVSDTGASKGDNNFKQKSKKNYLYEYGRDLTVMAQKEMLDPVLCREEEISRVIQILSRRGKNNPCLIGEPGVGKTAIIEGLAIQIVKKQVPAELFSKTVISLDLTSVLAGAKYRGDFEERIHKIIEQVKSQGDVILFIDEIHNIVGAGAAEGAIDAANILKPTLSRGEIQVIGATTTAEYKKSIEKDAALKRRFQTIMINEPSKEDTIAILNGLKGRYEEYHNVIYAPSAITAAVELSARYLCDRNLPDKAIDLLDESAARQKAKRTAENGLQNSVEQMLYHASTVAQKEEGQKKKYCASTAIIIGEDIAEIISQQSGIPLSKLSQSERQRLCELEENMHKRIIGQNAAVKTIANAIRRGRVGLKDKAKPIGSFLMLGPTGVGKTLLCKLVAEELFGTEEALVRFDMSEYMEKHAVSKLIGAPPGYIGYENGGLLTEKIKHQPYSVILFDEIEKAHPDIYDILLQILEDGRLTDSNGTVVDFKNTIIMMTSNIGATKKQQSVIQGFQNTVAKDSENSQMKNELKGYFKPELLNRIDDIVVFQKLSKAELLQIAKMQLDDFCKKAKEIGIGISVGEAVYTGLIDALEDFNYGARPIKREVSEKIECPLSNLLLSGEISENDEITLDYLDMQFCFQKKEISQNTH